MRAEVNNSQCDSNSRAHELHSGSIMDVLIHDSPLLSTLIPTLSIVDALSACVAEPGILLTCTTQIPSYDTRRLDKWQCHWGPGPGLAAKYQPQSIKWVGCSI